ncbi:hypothetical protein EPI10_002137 [Gossypium australe]|uniref:Uncharacterized protein n=1 Tax=Gossypium australe TaxID=47621 RepID=A0A5B6VD12_9ROSI|nr:hypothetical protein EPI10_002137 [Gossypium australe]
MLMKVLNETYVADDIFVNKLDRLVNNLSAYNFIFFNDDEIPSGGMGSMKALHITTRYKGYTLSGVLIDNGSALNVLPLSTLNRLPVDSSHMKTCQNIMRAFNGTERKVIGRIEIPFLIGLNTYEVNFLVMDIKPSNNFLLGRPWIHPARSSSLHQKLKLVTEGQLVTINAEEDNIVSVTSDTPYIGEDDEVFLYSYNRSPDINDTSDAAADSKSPFEQDMCLEEPQDFEDDRDCNLSLDLLRMVEQDEKQILPYKESVKVVSLGDKQEKKEVKIGAFMIIETKRNLIELLHKFKDVFAWSYQDMTELSIDIVVHRLPIKEECKQNQKKLQRMRPDVLLKIKKEVKKQFDADFL